MSISEHNFPNMQTLPAVECQGSTELWQIVFKLHIYIWSLEHFVSIIFFNLLSNNNKNMTLFHSYVLNSASLFVSYVCPLSRNGRIPGAYSANSRSKSG